MTDRTLPQQREDILSSIKGKRGSLRGFSEFREQQELDHNQMFARIEAQKMIEIQKMRKKWSDVVVVCVGAIVIFDFILITSIGLGWLHFDNAWTVPTILGDSLVKVLGLAFIIVNFLFSDKS